MEHISSKEFFFEIYSLMSAGTFPACYEFDKLMSKVKFQGGYSKCLICLHPR